MAALLGTPMHTWVHQRQLRPTRTEASFTRTRRRQRTSAWAVSATSATPAAAPEETSTSGEKWSVEAMRCGMATAQGPRETMEDAAQVALYAPCGYLYSSVFDGHNGSAAASFLQSRLYDIFLDVLNADSPDTTGELQSSAGLFCPLELSAILTRTYEQADEALLAWLAAHAPAQERDSGCTATTLLVGRDRIICANVGDSRAVLCRAGEAVDLTAEHRVYGRSAGVLAEVERVEAAGGWVHDGRVCGILGVARAFGDRLFKAPALPELLDKGVADGFWDATFAAAQRFGGSLVTAVPEVTELPLQEADEFVVLATDGLWDVIGSQEVARLVRRELGRGLAPQEVAVKLCDFALKRYTADNVAVVVVELRQRAAAGAAGGKKGGGGLFGLFGR